MSQLIQKLEWEDKYSVGVKIIDDQHRQMFDTINQLISAVSSSPTEEVVTNIISSLVEYKKFHFATEEKYFKEFNYEGAAEHIAQHQLFNDKLSALVEKCGADYMVLAFELVDFLEDWLIDHLLTVDQAYKECFQSHGLK